MLRTLPGSRRLHRKLVTGSSGVNQDVASATLPLWVCSCQATGGATGERNVVHRHHPHAARRRSEPGCWSSVGHSRHGGVEAAGGGLAVTHRVPVAVVVAVLRRQVSLCLPVCHYSSISNLICKSQHTQTWQRFVERCLVACAAYSCRFVPGRRCVRVMPPTGNGP